MRFKRLDLNLLPMLDSLLRTQSVSQSAKELFITQSAMSNALARLRNHFQDPLLVQVGRQMQPSPLAEELRSELRALMLSTEAIAQRKAGFDPASSIRSFGIALSDYSLRTFLAPVVPTLVAQAPGISLQLIALRQQPEELLNRADIHLVIAPSAICAQQHPSELLMRDEICCIVSQASAHPQERFTKSAFNKAEHIVFRPADGDEDLTLQACRDAGLHMNPKVSTFSFESMCEMVKGTALVGIIQRRLADLAASHDPAVRVVAMPSPLPRLDQMVQWHRAHSHDAALAWLRSQLMAAAQPR